MIGYYAINTKQRKFFEIFSKIFSLEMEATTELLTSLYPCSKNNWPNLYAFTSCKKIQMIV